MKHLAARMLTPALAGVFVCVLLSLGGCATPPQWSDLGAAWPADIPPSAQLTQVPFFPQEEYECGPASLAMAASAAGVKVLPEQLVAQVYLPGRKGSLQQEMLAATRRQGLLAYSLAPRLEAVLREVAGGQPVIVFQNLSLPVYPVWHYAVVIGYDREQGLLWLHSGRTERMDISFAAFENTWSRTGHWAMVAVAPNRLPVTAEADAHAAAAAALERVHPGAALVAYETGLQSWPAHRTTLLGAGNAAYAMGQLERAASAYRLATSRHPDFADAWNNLAQVMLELGQADQAREAIGHALALGGPRRADYLELKEKIDRAQPKPGD
jgi:tetratricopeptide (TPR) repeat protein